MNNDILLIYGLPGSGKTYYANKLLENRYILKIDTDKLKYISNMKEYILDIIKKKNISLMLSNNKERGLLIDDIDIFYKYDKKIYKQILDFIRDKQYYNCKIIMVCNKSFIKNKDLVTCKLNSYELKYSYKDFFKISQKIIKQQNMKLSFNECEKIIYSCNNSFTNLYSKLYLYKIDNKDNFDNLEKITNNIINNDKFNIYDLDKINQNDLLLLKYNLLENYIHYVNNYSDKILYIYYNFILSDKYDINNLENIFNIISIFYIRKYIRENYIENKINSNNNKYICKSMVNVVSKNKYYISNYKDNLFNIYILTIYYKYNLYSDYVINLYREDKYKFNHLNNKLKYFYNYKINIKKLIN